jgi:CubicO group peptidase (beta-lactamase class C family)
MKTPARSCPTPHISTLSRRTLMLVVTGGFVSPAISPLVQAVSAHSDVATLVATMDEALAAGVDQGIPGIALAIEEGSDQIYSGVAGLASIEEGIPLEASDRFRIYSITKTFTATVVYQLVDEELVALDDAVAMWLDEPAVQRIPHVERVTIRQLLNHTSGIYDFGDDDDSPFWEDAFLGAQADWTKVWTVPELLTYADPDNHAPYFAPGEGFHYSNTNYLLLGMIVEKATGSTFEDELQNRILTPLGLADTSLATGGVVPDGVVDGYQLLDGELLNVTAINLSWVWSAGGMVSTTADLLRFARATRDGELMSPASFAEMFSFVPSENPNLQFGNGLYKDVTPNGTLVGMDGGSAGFSANMMWLEEEDLTVVVLVNRAPDDGSSEALRDEAFTLALGQ